MLRYLQKDPHFSGRAARLASNAEFLRLVTRGTSAWKATARLALPVYSDRKKQVSRYHLKLTNKNIILHVSATQQEIWLAVYCRSNLIGVKYIHLSLTHSFIHWPAHNIPDAPTKRYLFTKNYPKIALSRFVCSSISWEQVVTKRQLYLNLLPCEKQKFQFTISN